MPPVIFNVGLFLDRRYMGDVIGLFCVSEYRIRASYIIFMNLLNSLEKKCGLMQEDGCYYWVSRTSLDYLKRTKGNIKGEQEIGLQSLSLIALVCFYIHF